MNTTLLKRLGQIISAITNGDYSQGKSIDDVLREKDLSEHDAEFIESLGLMTVKLEVKELTLKNTIRDLQDKNCELSELIKNRELFSTLFVYLFLSVSLYIFLIFIASAMNCESAYAPRVVELIFSIMCFMIVKKSKFPLTFFGFTLRGAMESIKYMLPSTLTICLVLVVVKYLCIRNGVNGLDGSLFYSQYFNMLLLLYAPVVVVQEFLAKGVVQTVIEHVLSDRSAKLWSIITAAALFGLVHIELSVSLAIASFIFGVYWGVIYVKSKTLVGVCISHFLIGNLAYLLGFWNYLLEL
jgi:hypothetical protein